MISSPRLLKLLPLCSSFIRPEFGTRSFLSGSFSAQQNLKLSENIKEMSSEKEGKSLETVELALNNWLKPQVLGEGWDNIGLLVGSGKFEKHEKIISGIMLCNDLRPAVLEEAISKNADMILAYHPPIFSGLKSISYKHWKERIIAKSLANDISIYSPHTTLDSTVGGINDRVLNSLKTGQNEESLVKAITPSSFLGSETRGVTFTASSETITKLYSGIPFQKFSDVILSIKVNGESAELSVHGKEGVNEIVQLAESLGLQELTLTTSNVLPCFGAGRIIELIEPLQLDDAVDMLKSHLGLSYVQLAYGGNPLVKTAAVCVGSGSSLLKPIAGKVDLLITGEMSHHDILECVSAQSSVVLCNHCSSERHYLPDLVNILRVITGISNIFVSEEDATPLRLVL
ncbi:NIF3-like protein 1 [Orchesella cincta]|uniref:NIF3-like protein 1 n=1 Tax=Orchesella cincta TaxID=48709 RepID=A0A1D2NJN0_ORCCI|nr:NIF3-like protein 1 [Orchesella cincta]